MLQSSFLSDSLCFSIDRAFKFKGLYFDFVYISSEQFLDNFFVCVVIQIRADIIYMRTYLHTFTHSHSRMRTHACP